MVWTSAYPAFLLGLHFIVRTENRYGGGLGGALKITIMQQATLERSLFRMQGPGMRRVVERVCELSEACSGQHCWLAVASVAQPRLYSPTYQTEFTGRVNGTSFNRKWDNCLGNKFCSLMILPQKLSSTHFCGKDATAKLTRILFQSY